MNIEFLRKSPSGYQTISKIESLKAIAEIKEGIQNLHQDTAQKIQSAQAEPFNQDLQNGLNAPGLDAILFDKATAKTLLECYLNTDPSSSKPRPEYVVAHTHQGIQKIPLSEVLYFQADQKYVTVHHETGQVLMLATLNNLAQTFKPEVFRIHRNALVNVKAILALEKNEEGHYFVTLKNIKNPLAVSRRQVAPLKRRIRELSSV